MPLPPVSPVDYIVHSLTERSIRVYFQEPVIESFAKLTVFYNLTIILGTTFVPNILEIKPYSTDGRQYEIILDNPITYSATYSLTIDGLSSINGSPVSNAGHNFVASITGGPVAINAVLSVRGCIDVIFDREVGPYSASANALISNGVATAGAVQVPWNPNIPAKNLRFTIPVGVPAGDEWYISARTPLDIALNGRISSTRVDIPPAVPRPLTFANTTVIQVIDAFVTNYIPYWGLNNVRLFLNNATDSGSLNPVNYSVFQIETHTADDQLLNTLTSPDPPPGDPLALITLANEIRIKYNRHLVSAQVHLQDDPNSLIAPIAVNLATASTIITRVIPLYQKHLVSEVFHTAKDPVNSGFPGNPTPNDLNSLIFYATLFKQFFNGHISPQYPVSGPYSWTSNVGTITNDFSLNNGLNSLNSNSCWNVDIRVKSLSPKSKYLLTCTLNSSDGLSATNPLNYTGQIIVKPATSPTFPLSISKTSLNSVEVKTNSNVLVEDSEVLDSNIGGIDKSFFYIRSGTSPESVLCMLTELWAQYDTHRSIQAHYVIDNSNFVSLTDIPSILTIVDSTNKFVNLFNLHRTGTLYHGIADNYFIPSKPAVTYEEAVRLIFILRDAFNHHTQEASLHVGTSQLWLSSPKTDSLVIQTPIQKIDQEYSIDIPVSSNVVYIGSPDLLDTYSNINVTFTGAGFEPEVAAIIPLEAVSYYRENPSFTSDVVELFFNKPMHQKDLSGITIIPVGIPPNPIVIRKRNWVSDSIISLNVGGMVNIQYSLNASSLEDKAGNSVI